MKSLMLKRTGKLLAVLLFAGRLSAQENQNGVHFEQSPDWSQVLDKAKAEHKYIFVDCYATWCGPCKMMDAEVYPDKAVGDYMNSRFISLKLQMDQTNADDSLTRSSYGLADMFARNYTISAYPSFLYFSPEGKIVHKHVGGGKTADFTNWARDAQDPDKQYYAILKSFQPGKLDTSELKGLVWETIDAGDKKLASAMALDYLQRTPAATQLSKDGTLMTSLLQTEPAIQELAIDRIKKFTADDYKEHSHVDLLKVFYKNEQVAKLVEDRTRAFKPDDFRDSAFLPLIVAFRGDTGIQKLVVRYLDAQPDRAIQEPGNLKLVVYFYQQVVQLNDRYFNFFLNQPRQADGSWGQDGISGWIIETVLNKTIAVPFYQKADSLHEEVDWKELKKELFDNSNRMYGNKVSLRARNDYYYAKLNKAVKAGSQTDLTRYGNLWSAAFVRYKNKYAFKEILAAFKDTTRDTNRQILIKASSGLTDLNSAWTVFLYSTNKKDLETALVWSKIGAQFSGRAEIIDTYANLLYKLGRKDEALKFEEQAVKLSPNQRGILENFKKMQVDKPTWTVFKTK